jgi:cobalt-zinc-cadmium efflux system protein
VGNWPSAPAASSPCKVHPNATPSAGTVAVTFASVGHTHDHSGGSPGHHHLPHSTGALKFAFFLNLFFTLIEAVGGVWTNSIAILSDALHDLGDSLVLGAAWYLQGLAARGPDARYSYGYGRYSMLGGWLAAGVLIIGSFVVLAFAIPRFFEPVLPHTPGMILIGVLGLLMNGIAAWALHRGTSLNERGVYLHLLEDVLGWVAILVGSVVMHFTGFARLDPLLSIGIALFILYNAIRTLRKGTHILMQGQPATIPAEEVHARLSALPHVTGVHDQHTWTLDGSYYVLSVHLVVRDHDLEQALETKEQARRLLHGLGIHHATIEIEFPGEQCGLADHSRPLP